MGIFQWRGRTSKAAFRDRVCGVFREKLPAATIEATGELDIQVTGLPSGKTLNVWLGRAYDEFAKAPRESDAIIARHVQGALALADDSVVDRQQIIPTIKSRDWLDSQSNEGRFDPWMEPYNTDLVIVYAEYRDGIRYGNRSDFEPLGMSAEAMREQAFANLRRMIGQTKVNGSDGGYLLLAGGTLDSSLVLLDEVLEDPRLQISGKPLIAVSDRGSFWVADDANPAAVFNVATSVAKCYRSEQYAISMNLYQRAGSVWEPLDAGPVDDAHPIPNLQVIDIHATKKSGGSDLVVIVASPLRADARSIFRLARKLDAYLQEINTDAYTKECGPARPDTTSVIVRLHPESDPKVEEVLQAARGWAEKLNASLMVEKLDD
jgi:uncharacterized protein YtpQ (UPF0354 family)